MEMYELSDIKNSKGMHIAHLNVRSLMNKWDAFKAQFENSCVHILGLSETWLNDKIPSSLFNLSKDYVLIRNDRNWSEDSTNDIKKGGGVCLFVNSKLHFCESTFAKYNSSNRNIECQWVSIMQPHSKQLVIGNIYRPPQGNIEAFIKYLEDILTEINLDRIELLLMGDFNIDFLDKNDTSYKKLLDLIKPLGLRQTIREPTRLANNRNSCLDLFITNADNSLNARVVNINLSDHLLILCSKQHIKIPKVKCNFIGRSYRNYDADVFKHNIIEANWENFDNNDTVTGKWEILEEIIRSNIDNMCPLKSFKIKQEKEPWITNELIEIIKDKDLALKRAKKRKDPELWKEAKRLRNTCIRRLREARADYIKENLNNNMGDQKKFWKNIQNVLPSKRTYGPLNLKLIDQSTGKHIAEESTASYINDFFVNIGPNLAKKCNTEWNFRGKNCENSINDIETDIDEIVKLCKAININKASCIEHLSSQILRDAFLAVPYKIVQLFNLSFSMADIPKSWKLAKITPLQKTGNKNDVSNLRPVSLLPLTSKLIEKIVHNRIYSFCETNNILDERQGGFRPNHSTCSTTAYFINDIYSAMNNNEVVIATFIDAMKAFDTVNHKILLQKAKKYGIKGQVLLWLENYLNERYQCTIANNIVSDIKLITCGVPQGSVCGPLLFLLYINDISDVLENCKVSLYADDTVIYILHENVNDALRLLQSDLDNLVAWCTDNKLTINSKKTKYCIFGMRSNVKRSKSIDTVLSLNNNILDRVCSYKYLGFILDDHLNFNKHISTLCNLVSHKLYLFSKIRKYLTTEACITIFKTMVLTVMEYGDIVYSGTAACNLNKIDKLFYRGLRICLGNEIIYSKNDLCAECRLSPLSKRRDLHLLLFMHKQSTNKDLLKPCYIATRLHNAPVFWQYKPVNEKVRYNILYRGALLWNNLPANVRNMNFKEFKILQKKSLLTNAT